MNRVHPLIPLGIMVAIAWIVALAIALRGSKAEAHSDKRAELERRMCDCKDLACVREVDREITKLAREVEDAWAGGDEALSKYGFDQAIEACRRQVRKRYEFP